jgi:Heterokaryon incompatibility protein (HET)
MDQSPRLPTIYTVCRLNPKEAEIRLLKVELAGSRDGALRCAFCRVSLNQLPPPFTAVSYCWGQAEHDHVIYLGSTAVKVTKIVDNVLRGVLAAGAAFVWIDQVCIDQGNTEERSHQVALMSLIYSRADRVLVYLGEAGEQTALAIAFVEHYHSRLKALGIPESQIAQTPTSESISFVKAKQQEGAPESEVLRRVALGLTDLLTRPFFKRLWVVQEVVFGDNLVTVCGSQHFQWYLLSLASLLFMRRPELASLLKSFVYISCDFATMRKASRLVREPGALVNRDLWEILARCGGLATSEPRDKIYAVLGLAKDSAALPRPDYAKSTREIYLDFARYFVRAGRGIEIIEAAAASFHQNETGYPSWAPWFEDMDTSKFRRETAQMNAAAHTAPLIWLGGLVSDLVVQGALVDRIIDMGPQGPTQGRKLVSLSLEHEDFLQWIEKSFAMLEAHNVAFPAASLTSILLQESPKISQESAGPAHLRLMDASIEVLSETLSGFIDSLCTVSGRAGLRSRLMTFRFDQETSRIGNITLLNDFAFQAIANLHDRRVFVTARNRVGLGYNTIDFEDEIAIISGGRTPYVLRREQEDLRRTYGLVTWAYVQGIMHGEALEEPGCRIEDLIIR